MCCSDAHLKEVSCLLGKLGAYIFEVFLVEFAVKVATHLILIEGPVFAERTHKLDPATGEKQAAEAARVLGSVTAILPNPAGGLENRPQTEVQSQQRGRLGLTGSGTEGDSLQAAVTAT